MVSNSPSLRNISRSNRSTIHLHSSLPSAPQPERQSLHRLCLLLSGYSPGALDLFRTTSYQLTLHNRTTTSTTNDLYTDSLTFRVYRLLYLFILSYKQRVRDY